MCDDSSSEAVGIPTCAGLRGISKTIFYLQQLDGLGVNFKSYTEQYLDTDNELIRHVVLGMLAYFAKLQREKST